MPGWVYSNPNGLAQGEQQVRRWDNGKYPWVSTSSFAVGTTLPYHSHHSHNTHLIVQGSMLFRKRLPPQDESLYTLGHRINIKPLESYGGQSREGCDFVEGHAILSPRTRDRFILRGKLVWAANANNAGPVQGQVIQDGDVTVRVIAAAKQKERRRSMHKVSETCSVGRAGDDFPAAILCWGHWLVDTKFAVCTITYVAWRLGVILWYGWG